MQIYITRNDEQFGPYPESEVRQNLMAGELLSDDLAWHEGLVPPAFQGELTSLPHRYPRFAAASRLPPSAASPEGERCVVSRAEPGGAV